MAYINMSDIIKDSAAVDMVAIAKTLDKDPQMIMWDPDAESDCQRPRTSLPPVRRCCTSPASPTSTT